MTEHEGSQRTEVRLSHTVSPVLMLAVVARKLGIGSVSGLDRRAVRGVLTLRLDAAEAERLALAVRRGELPGVEVLEPPAPDGRRTQLMLTRRPGEAISIGDEVEVAIDEIRGQSVRVRVAAPRHVFIARTELLVEGGR